MDSAEEKIEAPEEQPSPQDTLEAKILAIGMEEDEEPKKDIPAEEPPPEIEDTGEQAPSPEELPEEEPPAEEPKVEPEEDIAPPQSNAEAAKLRRYMKKEREERKRLEQEIESLRGERQQAPVAQPQQPDATPEQAIQVLLAAKRGEYGERSQALERQAIDAIQSDLTSQEISHFLAQANSGMLGEDGQDIAGNLSAALNVALSKEMQQSQQQQQQTQMQEQASQDYQRELRALYKKHAELSNKESEVAKHINVWAKDWIGEFDDDTGELLIPSDILNAEESTYLLHHPRLMGELTVLHHNASKAESLATENKRLQKEMQTLKQQLAGITSPEGSTTELGDDGKETGAAAIERKLMERMAGMNSM